jgi:diguanylate cyclase (GGDEF)-like protein
MLLFALTRFYTDSSSTKALYLDRMAELSNAASKSFSRIIELHKNEISRLALSLSMREYLRAASGSVSEAQAGQAAGVLRDAFMVYVDRLDIYDDMVLMDAGGRVVLGCKPETLGIDLSDRDYYLSHLNAVPPVREGHVMVSRVHDSITQPDDPNARCVTLSVCFRNNDGSLRYVLAAYINANALGMNAEGITFGDTGIAFVADAGNYILYHPEPRFVNTYIATAEMADLTARYQAGEIPPYGPVETVLDGIPRMYYYRIIPEYDMVVALRQDLSDYENARYAYILLTAALVLILLALASVFGLWLSGRAARPVALLSAQFSQGAETGEYTACTVAASVDEIKKIAYGYNEMVSRLGSLRGAIQVEKERNDYMATHDYLTGLLNRRAFEREFARHLQPNRNAGLIFIEINRFKQINDTYGNLTADAVLSEFGRRVMQSAAGFEACARAGSDKFMAAKTGGKESIERAIRILRDEITEPFDMGKTRLHITGSAGIAIYPRDGLRIDNLISNAEIAMNSIEKQEGDECRCAFYDIGMREKISRSGKVTEVLRNCVAEREIFFMYQPLYNLGDGNNLAGFEALMRIRNSELGLLSPTEFLPIAERDKALSVELGNWALDEACRFMRRLIDQKGFEGYVSVNISGGQLEDGGFVEGVLNTLKEHGVPPRQLQLEVTEKAIDTRVAECALKLEALREEGVIISLDDFGDMRSSFYLLSYLPLDSVKIDHTFFAGLNTDNRVSFMNKSVLELAKRFDLRVSAERVESQGECDALKSIGYDSAQGYLFSLPLMEESAVEKL